ncbi:M14 family metallocarboxypeptidase [Pseudoalteromonas piscicida]|uniref:M14 family metallopeptidase n=1 Tax=Pseudoalteromonas piscicida TaxID=43662 RepID=UPI0030B4C856
MQKQYPIGTLGVPWSAAEKQQWLSTQTLKRSYFDEVVTQIEQLTQAFEVTEYGQLSYSTKTYPLFALTTKRWNTDNPTILVTGGVHGYETSGIHGALAFAKSEAAQHEADYNFIILPCLSPWGYETINRWNPAAVDPNRSFYEDSPAPESRQAMQFVQNKVAEVLCHVDLHETTDSDNSEFRPALAAREGKENHNWNIPDGFYLVGHTQKPEAAFQECIIEEVAAVTQIADADENGQLIGVAIEQHGVINYDGTALGLCMGMTEAPFVTTTEVYPDGKNATPENCIAGQVAAIRGAIKYLKKQNNRNQG